MVLRVDPAEADVMVGKIRDAAEHFKSQLGSLVNDSEMMDWSGAAREAFINYIGDVKVQFTQQVESYINGSAETLSGSIKALIEADNSVGQGMAK
jgi:hypothetical protein